MLVGPSGCGKSTALRMVAGLEDISTGDLLIGGRRVNDVDPQGRDIAMVFQSYALYPHMSVARQHRLRAQAAQDAQGSDRARGSQKAADMLELTPLLDRKPKQLSGGQRQRVAMGRSIVREPQVFLMDEPLSNLDAKLRVQMRAEISAVVRSLNTTTLYVTHDQTEAMTMGDRMAVMKAGVLQQLGSPTECYDTPVNIFVAQFVGSPPMNLVVVQVEEGPDGLQLRGERSTLAIPDSVLSARPALKSYVGKPVVVGIRSEDMEDASLAKDNSPLRRLAGKVTLTEALGSELVVHFTFPGTRFETADTKLDRERRRGRRAAHRRRTGHRLGRLVRPAVPGADGGRDRGRHRCRAHSLFRSRDLAGNLDLSPRRTDAHQAGWGARR